jgi:hypothetical protein
VKEQTERHTYWETRASKEHTESDSLTLCIRLIQWKKSLMCCRAAFAMWLLMNLLLVVVPRYGAYAMMVTGALLLSTDLVYYMLIPFNPLVVRFEGSALMFRLGWCFWLVITAGDTHFTSCWVRFVKIIRRVRTCLVMSVHPQITASKLLDRFGPNSVCWTCTQFCRDLLVFGFVWLVLRAILLKGLSELYVCPFKSFDSFLN